MLTILMLFFIGGPATVEAKTGGDQGTPTLRTPYDARYQRVNAHLMTSHQSETGPWNPSLSVQQEKIQRYLSTVRRFRFQEEPGIRAAGSADHWQLPEETERLGGGDCEDLTIWLAGAGAENMHAWATWYGRGTTYIMDPSRSDEIVRSDQLADIIYRPQYSFYLDQRWRYQ